MIFVDAYFNVVINNYFCFFFCFLLFNLCIWKGTYVIMYESVLTLETRVR